jgi:SAM-dependent methyltransferase
VTDHEAFVRRFHAVHAGATSHALARTGCYARFAERVLAAAHDSRVVPGSRTPRILDLACGDGALLACLPPNAVGVDVSLDELRGARAGTSAGRSTGPGAGRSTGAGVRVVQGRAQALPFADGAFEVVACHLAFMLFDDVERVVTELRRVLAPGGSFVALLGGGPTADGDDAFHEFLALLAPHAATAPKLGDPRARSEAGWRALFPDADGWDVAAFERWELDASGTFEEVWAFLGASYQLPPAAAPAIRAQLAARYMQGGDEGDARVPCTIVTWIARAKCPVVEPEAGADDTQS